MSYTDNTKMAPEHHVWYCVGAQWLLYIGHQLWSSLKWLLSFDVLRISVIVCASKLTFLKLQVYYPDVLDDFLQRTIWEVTFGNCLTWQVIGWAISLPLRLISTNPISSWRALLPVEMVGQSNSDGSHSREEGNIFSTEPSVLLTYIYIYLYIYS